MPTSRSVVVGLIGHARAGKTTLAHAVADAHGDAAVASFGDAARRRARELGLDPNERSALVEIGQEWVASDPTGYCRAVLAQQGGAVSLLIVEGVRHEEIRRSLERLVAPRPIAFVHLKAPRDLVVARLERDGELPEQAAGLLNDPTETQVDQFLLGIADLILDASAPVEENVRETLDLVRRLRDSQEQIGEAEHKRPASGLSDDQQEELVNAISTEFELMLPREVSARTGLTASDLEDLQAQGLLLALDRGGKALFPGFLFEGQGLARAIGDAVQTLSQEMTEWEVAAWLIANNGYLDGERPVDVAEASLAMAVRAELEQD